MFFAAEPPLPPQAAPPPPSVSVHVLSLYIGSCVCLLGLVLTRQAYKLSPGFRAQLAATGFHTLAADAPAAVKAQVMLSALQDAWPATVSEMLQDTDAAHGMIFRSLMVTGCLAALQADFSALTPAVPWELPAAAAIAVDAVHLLRRLVLAAAVGFCFAPASGRDHGVAALRKQFNTAASGEQGSASRLATVPWLREARVKELPPEQRAEIARTTIVGTVHCLLAAGMLSGAPWLELLALLREAYAAAPQHITAAAAADACGLAWCGVWLLRLLHVGAIHLCMSVFTVHFIVGFYT